MLVLKPRMSTLEDPSQIEEARTAVDRSFLFPGENISDKAGFTGDVARMVLRACEYGSLVDCGCLEMSLPSPEDRGYQTLSIAGGFKSSPGYENRRNTWTWGVRVKTPEGLFHIVSDIDLIEGNGRHKVEIEESEESLVAVPGNGKRNLINLWQQVEPDFQGRLKRRNFIYDKGGQITGFIKRTFEHGVMPYLDNLFAERTGAQILAETHKPSALSDIHVASNAVGFRGATGLTNIDLASSDNKLNQSTKAERVLTLDELPAALSATFSAIFPPFDCPVAILEKLNKTKRLDIKELKQPNQLFAY